MAEQAIEVEFKFQVLEPEKVLFLEKLEFKGEKRVDDVYLDTKTADLFKRGIFIRIRNNKTLDFKFNPEQFDLLPGEGIHEQCMEYNFSLPLHENDLPKLNEVLGMLSLPSIAKADLHELRKQNQWIDSQVFNKTRKRYAKPPFEYCLDEVENFGTFLEIEATTQDPEEAERLKEQIRQESQELGLKLITTGYNELWWKKNNPEIYWQGKFLLEEDKPAKKTL
jgi:adenylate cyclase class IV